jgi:Protein of unknown function (DUF3617)
MKRNSHAAALRLAGVLALAGAMPAQAQTLQPGLWELSSATQSGSGDMEKAMTEAHKQLAALPPEQRKMMQDMLARQGVAMGTGNPGTMQVKVCMTAEMLARNEIVTQKGDCRSQHAARVGSSMKFTFSCTKPPSSGDGEVTFESPRSYNARINVNSSAGGKQEQFTVRSRGKWLSTDCGNVKPVPAGRP